jgi:hypothetical protein
MFYINGDCLTIRQNEVLRAIHRAVFLKVNPNICRNISSRFGYIDQPVETGMVVISFVQQVLYHATEFYVVIV